MKSNMNNILKVMACLFVAGASLVSCKDEDNATPGTDREFMTMFICDNTRGKGDYYPWNSGLDGKGYCNDIHLYWYGVKDCAGYQIQMALQPKVSGGADSWNAIQGTKDLLMDTIVGPNVLDMLIRDLQYSTKYQFAIRCLSKLDNNEAGDHSHASNWYGHGNLRQWQEYFTVTTDQRYPTPPAIYVDRSQISENQMPVYLRRNIKEIGNDISDADKKSYPRYFNIDGDGNFGYKYLVVEPSPSNPGSSVGEKWRKYLIQEEDYKRGFIMVDGLSPNSVYVIDVIDPTVTVAVDAKYNTCTERTDGKPGPAILLKHQELIAAEGDRSDTFALASHYDAAPLSPTLYRFISETTLSEGQVFYLEGGKTYYLDGNDITCKGFTLATLPEDVAKGKRAKVISGIGKNSQVYSSNEQWLGSYTMFMFGRQPEAGEGGAIRMKKLAFQDIDFDNPTSLNQGDKEAGAAAVSGNYFFNMYSNGMAVELDSLVIENCTFKRLVRGFVREQGDNYKIWNHVLIKNNLFYDCGYYNAQAGGYSWIAGAGTNEESNLYKDFKFIENTIYDCPFPSFFSEQTSGIDWKSGPWNITFSNNTLVNFNTRGNGAIFKMRCLPSGSVFNVQKNLIVLCAQEGDARTMEMYGADIRDPLGTVTLNFDNNWSTNNNLTNGSIFSGSTWAATSNSFGTIVKSGEAILHGSLDVSVAGVSATELFVNPCPPHKASTTSEKDMHRADALDGTASEFNVDLHIKHTNNEIVKNEVGAARWR